MLTYSVEGKRHRVGLVATNVVFHLGSDSQNLLTELQDFLILLIVHFAL
jgi:hypothetical protein